MIHPGFTGASPGPRIKGHGKHRNNPRNDQGHRNTSAKAKADAGRVEVDPTSERRKAVDTVTEISNADADAPSRAEGRSSRSKANKSG